ncbi:MAG: preprotein translocase subunit SecY [Candidatus Hydrogenedentota bacterium]
MIKEAILNAIKIPDLKKKFIFTLTMIFIYRLGAHIPTPGVDPIALKSLAGTMAGGLLGFANMFTGGALFEFSIFSLGIMPYISASIILQLLAVVIPQLEALMKEGEYGRRKITQYTRYGTIVLSMIQAIGWSIYVSNQVGATGPVVPEKTFMFYLVAVVTMTCGTTFLMWMGEQITERGIGNGISLLIFVGIISRFPQALYETYRIFTMGELGLFSLIAIGALFTFITAASVVITEGHRKIPIQYAKRIIGRKVYGGAGTSLPLRVNSAGVMPVIFASSFLMFPMSMMAMFSRDYTANKFLAWIALHMGYGSVFWFVAYSVLIILFAYFYTAIQFNPKDVADNLKKHGGFIPGIRPGKTTAQYIDFILTRITLAGAIFLALISILPDFLVIYLKLPSRLTNIFGGTSILIIVGVALDTMRQIESHLLMRHYDGFVKRGRIRGR